MSKVVESMWNDVDSICKGVESMWKDVESMWNDVESMWNDVESMGECMESMIEYMESMGECMDSIVEYMESIAEYMEQKHSTWNPPGMWGQGKVLCRRRNYNDHLEHLLNDSAQCPCIVLVALLVVIYRRLPLP